ncbi:hypothetical protein Hanom_Chr15g01373561 [Helianthus anomalus]
MPFLSLRLGQFCNFHPKVCFSTFRSKRFNILPFIRLVNFFHFSPLSQGHFHLFCLLKRAIQYFSLYAQVFTIVYKKVLK